MLSVTEAAGARLAQMLKQQDVPEDTAVRFVCEGQGIALRQDSVRAGNTTFQHEDRTVWRRDAQVSELLAEDPLDPEGAKLTRQHPQEGE
ncbi:MAG: hypothetical protein KKB50_14395 [Planctomycetes bacterium]|nr:hypothetical protein [Planctomycetota bacterium]